MLTIAEVTKAMPPQLKGNVSQDLVDLVNNISNDPEACRTIRETFISYTSVLKEGRFKSEDYVYAVTYVSYKLMGYNNKEAYARTFPARYQALVAKGATEKDISAYVSAYNKGKLVNLILEQTLIPVWVLNQEVYQKAISVQAELMMTAKSEKVRAEAANSILTHLKKPEKKEIELRLDTADNSGLNELKDKLLEMAQLQQELIQAGLSTKDIAHQRLVPADDGSIIDAEVIESSGPNTLPDKES